MASIRSKGSKTDEQMLAAVTHKGHSLVKGKGVNIGLLEFMELVDKGISAKIAKNYSYNDIVLCFVILAISPEFRGKMAEVPETMRASLEALLGG